VRNVEPMNYHQVINCLVSCLNALIDKRSNQMPHVQNAHLSKKKIGVALSVNRQSVVIDKKYFQMQVARRAHLFRL